MHSPETDSAPQAESPPRRPRWPGWVVRISVLAVLLWYSVAPGNPALYPPPGFVRVSVVVVDHGYHAGLVVRAVDLKAIAAALRAQQPEESRLLAVFPEHWPTAEWFEFGWGDAAFYQAVRTPADVQLRLAIAALFWPTPSVVQVVPGQGPIEDAFPGEDRVTLDLSAGGWRALAVELARSIEPSSDGLPQPVGPSLYGSGIFVRSSLSYDARRTCNQWVSGLLRAAGVPSSWFWSMTSTGLMEELRLRALPDGVG